VESGEFKPALPVDDMASWIISTFEGMMIGNQFLGPDKIQPFTQELLNCFQKKSKGTV
jgi:hypothetical protein